MKEALKLKQDMIKIIHKQIEKPSDDYTLSSFTVEQLALVQKFIESFPPFY